MESDNTYEYDPASLPRHLTCLMHHRVTGCRSSNQNTVCTQTVRLFHDNLAGSRTDRCHTKTFCLFNFLGINVDSYNPTTIGFQQLHSQESDESETYYHDRLAELWLQVADTLKGNRTYHRKCRLFVCHPLRYLSHQILGHTDILGMRTIRCHSVADLETTYARTYGHHSSHITITQWQRLFQLMAHCIDRRLQTVRLYLIQHLFYFVRL